MKARYIMTGGFLGAGKTTAIGQFGRFLAGRGLKVGLITNDQGGGLVDSALGRSRQFPVEEIAGGCFCCRFHSLLDAAHNLTAASRPDVLLAEPVGSCTDLVATVSLPLQQIYGDEFTVSPLSVVVDPVRARRVLGLEEGRRFSSNVSYIYLKQLEEAEAIVINKIDLVADAELHELEQELSIQFPQAQIFRVSARHGDGLEAWFEWALDREMDPARIMDVDYERYAEGEALLGWLNAAVSVEHPDGEEFDGNALLSTLAQSLHEAVRNEGVEVAHLKMTLNPLGDPLEVAAISLVRSDHRAELSHQLADPLEAGEILLNIRCEAAPDLLDRLTREALQAVVGGRFGLDFRETHREHFRPGKPVPTHRATSVR
ncbi:MAG TPA: GTP-binding protein [Verrucomicrobiales bacterium]|nr:GTP-binding protein [Verrucomicrobiales bacterium]